MEFGEKLQALRRGREMTQEELAHALYVSRTAISKWESGRGYPNIDSLKAISKYFAVSIDELLSGDALLSIAEDESREREARLRSLTFGLLDCAAAMLLFLPFFADRTGGAVRASCAVWAALPRKRRRKGGGSAPRRPARRLCASGRRRRPPRVCCL